MTVKRYVAESARECLRRVKEDLGPDAIVVSNRQVAGGVEITAMSSDSLEALSAQMTPRVAVGGGAATAYSSVAAAPAQARPRAPATDSADDYTVSLSSSVKRQQSYQPWAPTPAAAPEAKDDVNARLRPLPPRVEDAPSAAQVAASLQQVPDASVAAPKQAVRPAPVASAAPANAQVTQLMDEMQLIRGLLERQLAGFAWGSMSRESPVRAQLLGELLDAGFSGQFSRKLADELPADMQLEEARKWARNAVGRNLRTLGTDGDLIDRGGVYALVGPTGVGKTTTTAKLAARCVVRYGADKLALLTTDSYRIGAHEQLRIYGRILGVPVHVVRDGEDLRHTLSDLRDKHMVLIDTVGMSQRDRMVAEQAAMLARSGQVNRLLLLNATSRGDTLDDVVRAYAGEDLAGCILTKLDETATIAPAIDTIVRHGLLMSYVATGQRVPEDLHLPNRNYLLHRCFKTSPEESPHHLQNDEVGLAVAGSKTAQAMAKVLR
ncbi:MAG TPA: flagellar biosynthesis protein FlhF [Rhodocyclaceae bacterium]|jgi:flagellar biosynthesis protein FlhF|nr:flagellar biosynthesis protein FlhF [Rhodocyclaceae bacterium]